MSDENPSILSHVSVGVNDFQKALAFYDAVMPTIGAKRLLDFPGGVAYGKVYPEFWVSPPHDEGKAECANGVHFAFNAVSKEEVDAFWKAAIEAGASPDGEPGPRPLYGEAYYGCFVRDLDGHKIEAMYWDMALGGE
ncbi:MAG: VOC family protein [Rhizobiaceae bacterium]|nr:VOC family protein [Rhizobiaceae bacterium]